jgi:hypothetical protein
MEGDIAGIDRQHRCRAASGEPLNPTPEEQIEADRAEDDLIAADVARLSVATTATAARRSERGTGPISVSAATATADSNGGSGYGVTPGQQHRGTLRAALARARSRPQPIKFRAIAFRGFNTSRERGWGSERQRNRDGLTRRRAFKGLPAGAG